ncbi:MAG: flagellar biosynthesis anti-sigma factor FlgM [Bryobacterales bacterium]|nr:flagellar biosynthesis anti-sigma factor FlgM [Bryobacterales bacterium]
MKINDRIDLSTSQLGQTRGAEGTYGPGGRTGVRTPGGAGEDQADVSRLAGALTDAITGAAPERAARVEQLRLDVQSGRYEPDAQAIARGVVTDALSAGE